MLAFYPIPGLKDVFLEVLRTEITDRHGKGAILSNRNLERCFMLREENAVL